MAAFNADNMSADVNFKGVNPQVTAFKAALTSAGLAGKKVLVRLGDKPSELTTNIAYGAFTVRFASLSEALSGFVIPNVAAGVSEDITLTGLIAPGQSSTDYWTAIANGPFIPGLKAADFKKSTTNQNEEVTFVQLVNNAKEYEVYVRSEEGTLFGGAIRKYILSFTDTPIVATPANYKLQLTTGAQALTIIPVPGATDTYYVVGTYRSNLAATDFIPDANVAALTAADVTDNGPTGSKAETYTLTIGGKAYTLEFRPQQLDNNTSLTLFNISAAAGGTARTISVKGTGFEATGAYIPGLTAASFTPLADAIIATGDVTAGTVAETYNVTVTAAAGNQDTYTLSFAGGYVGPTTPSDLSVAIGTLTGLHIVQGPDGNWYVVDANLNPVAYSPDATFSFGGQVYSATPGGNGSWIVNGWTIYSADSINRGGGSSGGGCDAGLGALGLMALAGSAIVLRRKK
jgi:hypothetical protein